MSHKRVVVKRGKTYGPYLYESYRDEHGNVKKRYLGKASDHVGSVEQKHFSWGIWIAAFILFLLVFSGIAFTGKATLSLDDIDNNGEILTGDIEFVLQQSELIPDSTNIIISTPSEEHSYSLSDLLDKETSEGDFYLKDTDLSGYGSGYGLSLERFPPVSFVLGIYEVVESEPEEPEENDFDGTRTIPETEPILPGNESGESGEDEEPDDNSSQDNASRDISIHANAVAISADFLSLTAHSTLELVEEISSNVRANETFTYGLESGQTAEIISSEESVDLSIDDGAEGSEAVVTTDYLGNEEEIIVISLDELNITAESGTLEVRFVHEGKELLSGSKEIAVVGGEPSEEEEPVSNGTRGLPVEEPPIIEENESDNETGVREVMNMPDFAYVMLNSTYGTNYSDENLTVYTDQDNNASLKIIGSWYKNGAPFAELSYPFEGGSNTTWTKDYSEHGINGTVVNSATWNSTGGYDGFGAYEFDAGSLEYINTTWKPSYATSTGAMPLSVSLWFKTNDTDADTETLFGHYNSGDTYFQLWTASANLVFGIQDEDGDDIKFTVTTGDYDWADGKWHHVAVTTEMEDNINNQVYLDGVSRGTRVETDSFGASKNWRSHNLFIGARSDTGTPGLYWNGTIDDVIVFEKVLTQEQALELYRNRTDFIVSNETAIGDVWEVCVTPNNGTDEGTSNCSNTLTILNKPPVMITSFLNTTTGRNRTIDNLTCWANATDFDESTLNYTGEWYKNGILFVGKYWNATTSGPFGDSARAIAVDASDNVYITGYSLVSGGSNFLTVKYNSSGDQQWNATGDTSPFVSSYDYGYGIAVSPAGNVYVTGGGEEIGTPNDDDFLTYKYNSAGTHQWNASYDGGVGDDRGYAVALDAAENVYVTGVTFVGGSQDIYTVKYDSTGAYVWNASFGGLGSQAGYGIAIDNSGNVYVAGSEINDFLIVAYDSSGIYLWDTVFDVNSSTDVAEDIAVDGDGNIYIAGYFDAGTDDDYFIAKYNNTGEHIWNRTYDGGIDDDRAYSIDLDPAGNVYVAGYSEIGSDIDYYIIKYNSNGEHIWNRTYDGGEGDDKAYGIAVNSSGEFYVTGESYLSGDIDYFTLKYRDGFFKTGQAENQMTLLDTMESDFTSREDNWSCSVQAHDGVNYSTPLLSNNVSVVLECNETITDSVALFRDLTCNADGLIIDADNLVVDCDGYSITGDGGSGDYGINNSLGYDNITVKNCTIDDFQYGIYFNYSANSSIINNTIINCYGFASEIGAYLYAPENNLVENNTFEDNYYGLYLNGVLTILDNATVTFNRFVNNRYGLNLGGFINDSLIYNNYFANNTNSINAFAAGADNLLNTTLNCTGERNIINGSCIGGNYYDDYSGFDTDGDGIGDTDSYNVTIGGMGGTLYDYLPLANNPIMRFLALNSSLGNNYTNEDLICWANATSSNSGDVSYNGYWILNNDDDFWNNTKAETGNLFGRSIAVDDEGNVYVAGYLATGDDDHYIMKYYPNGSEAWSHYVGGGSDERSRAVDVDNNGGVYFVGDYAWSRFTTYKYNTTTGTQIWSRNYLSGEAAYGVAVGNQGVYVLGEPPGDTNYTLVKYKLSNPEMWVVTLTNITGNGGLITAKDLAVDSDDNIYVLAQCLGAGTYDICVVKHNSTGDVIWNATHGSTVATDYSYDIAVSNDDDSLYLLGQNASNMRAVWIFKINSSDGSHIWNFTTNISEYGVTYYPEAIAVDSAENIYVAGYHRLGSSYNFSAVKINSSGDILWDIKKAHGTSTTDVLYDLALDDKGNGYVPNVYVSGAYDTGMYYRAYVEKIPNSFSSDDYASGELADAFVLDELATSAGDNWTCKVRAHENPYSQYNLSNNLEILNDEPVFSQVFVNATSEYNRSRDNLTCWANATNDDEQNITYYVDWLKNGVNMSYLGYSEIWNITYDNSSENEYFGDIAFDDDSSVIYIGGYYLIGGHRNSILMRYNLSGQQEWIQTRDAGGDNNTYIHGVAYEGSYVYTAGRDYNTTMPAEWVVTSRYYASTGASSDYVFNSSPISMQAGMDVDEDSNGYIYTAGYIYPDSSNTDALVIKYYGRGPSLSSGYQWNKTYNISQYDKIYGVKIDPSNSSRIYLAGITGNSSYSEKDVLLMRINSSGDLIWNSTYDNNNFYDYARSVAVDSNGDVYVVGNSHNSTGDNTNSWLILKFNQSDGSLLENYTSSSGSDDYAEDIKIDSSGNILVAGRWAANTSIAMKYDSGMNYIANFSMAGYTKNATRMALNGTSSKNIFVAAWGLSMASPGSQSDIVVSKSVYGKINNATLENQLPGQLVAAATLDSGNTSENENWSCMVVAYDGVDFVTNFSDIFTIQENIPPAIGQVFVNSSSGNNMASDNLTCWVNATDNEEDNVTYSGEWYKDGDIFIGEVWNATFNGDNDQAYDVAVDSLGNVFVIGYTNATGDYDYITLKYNSSGDYQWNATYDGGIGGLDYGYGVAVDNFGNAYVTGQSNITGTSYDIHTIKYDSSGNEVWNATFDSGGYDKGNAITVNSNGDVYVTGQQNVSALLVKYNSSGDYQWNVSYNMPGFSNSGQGIDVDSQGNIYVAGTSSTSYPTVMIYCFLAKYDSSGSHVWNATDGGGFDYRCNTDDVAIDSNGNAYLLADRNLNSNDVDMMVYRYNSSGGYLGNFTRNLTLSDEARGIEIDSSDKIYILGYYNNSGDYDAVVFKTNTSGYGIWNKTINTSTNSYANALDIDSGNLYIAGHNGTTAPYDFFVFKYRNGFALSNQVQGQLVNASTLDSSFTSLGDKWSCSVQAYNGDDYSDTNFSNILTIEELDCICVDCSDCESKLNNPACDVVNLTIDIDTASDCININTSSISNKTFDCQGHYINGSYANAVGINVSNNENFTINNCTITKFYNGIMFDNTSYHNVNHCNLIDNNISGIYMFASDNVNFFNNYIYNNARGVLTRNSHYGDYEYNNVSDNDKLSIDYNFYMINASYSEFKHNFLTIGNNYNFYFPLDATYGASRNITFYNNTIMDGDRGIYMMHGGGGNNITGNYFSGLSGAIDLQCNVDNSIIRLNIIEDSSIGIEVDKPGVGGDCSYRPRNVVVDSNIINDTGFGNINYALRFDDAADFNITNNQLIDINRIGFSSSYSSSQAIYGIDNFSIHNNTFIGCGNAMKIEVADDTNITNNHIINSTGYAMYFGYVDSDSVPCTGFYAFNNTLTDNDGGIYLEHVDNSNFVNNTVTGSDIGIYLVDSDVGSGYSPANNNFTGNHLYNNTDWSFLDNAYCTNYLDDTNLGGYDGKPIYHKNTAAGSVNLQNTDDYSLIILCDADNSLIQNVTIDNGELGSDGIYLSHVEHAVIKNCNVSNSNWGVYMRKGSNETIQNNFFGNVANAGITYSKYGSSHKGLIENNTVINSGNIGIYVTGVNSPQNLTVANNTISNTVGHGLAFGGYIDYCDIINNSVYNSSDNGINFGTGTNNHYISENKINSTNGWGIYADQSADSSVLNNEIYNVAEGGMVFNMRVNVRNNIIDNVSGPVYEAIEVGNYANITNNTITNILDRGISLYANTIVANNTLRYIGDDGLYASAGSNSIDNNTFEHITDVGIIMDDNGNVNNITSNKFYNVSDDAIYVESRFNEITNNIINKTGDLGIDIRYQGDAYNTISDNEIINGNRGIYLYYSDENTIEGNIIANSTSWGITVYTGGNKNHIYNNWLNNTYNARDIGSNNDWNTTYNCDEESIIGGCLGGNFWNEYYDQRNLTDRTGDGIGDDGLPIDGSYSTADGNVADYLPLAVIRCGDELIGDTEISSLNELSGCNPNGLDIVEDNIELNCNNYIINGTGSYIGINVSNVDNISIKRCPVYNFNTGIFLDNTDNSFLFHNMLISNSLGINISSGSTGGLIYYNYFNNTNDNNAYDLGDNDWNDSIVGNFWSDYNETNYGNTPKDDYNVSVYAGTPIPGQTGAQSYNLDYEPHPSDHYFETIFTCGAVIDADFNNKVVTILGDMHCDDEDGIIIDFISKGSVDNVTIDCDGRSITGDGTHTAIKAIGSGSQDLELKNSVIENCIISNFSKGIEFKGHADAYASCRVDGCAPREWNEQQAYDNVIRDNEISDCNYGIYFSSDENIDEIAGSCAWSCKDACSVADIYDNNISGNELTNNNIAIYFTNTPDDDSGDCSDSEEDAHVENNILENNIITNNSVGIKFTRESSRDDYPRYNLIYNNLFNNTDNADASTSPEVNYWNNTYAAGTSIVGGPYIGGNYWSNYTGTDTGADYIGDTLIPFNDSETMYPNGDWLPLIYSNLPPEMELVFVNSSSGDNFTSDDLYCWAKGTDADGDTLTYLVEWYRNGLLFENIDYNITYDFGYGGDYARGIVTDSSGNVYVAGYFNNSAGDEDYLTIKYDSSGNEIWNATYDGGYGDDNAFDIDLDSLENIYVTGSANNSAGDEDYYTIKYNSSGDYQWNTTYDGENGLDRATSVAVSDSGNVYVTGYSDNGANRDYYTIKYNSSGDYQWNSTYDSTETDQAVAISLDSFENVYVTGNSNDTGNRDWFTIKYNSSGDYQWNSTYGSGYGHETSYDIAVDSLDNIYVTGNSRKSGGYTEYYTIKYNATNGNEIWNTTYSISNYDSAWAIAIDSYNNIYVTGQSSSGGDYDYLTVKYNSSRDYIWSVISDRGFGDDTPYGIALDSIGDIYVVGYSDNGADDDWWIVKYSSFKSENHIPGELVAASVMNSTETFIGDNWSCFVGAYDGIDYTDYVASNSLTIRNLTVANIECEINTTDNWLDCDNLLYYDNITRVRVNCSEGALNATFNLTNLYDNQNFFYNNTITQAGGYFVLDNNDTQILDSGNWSLIVECTAEALSTNLTEEFSIPFGNLTGAVFIDPSANINVLKYEVFNITTEIGCTGGECVEINTTLDPREIAAGTCEGSVHCDYYGDPEECASAPLCDIVTGECTEGMPCTFYGGDFDSCVDHFPICTWGGSSCLQNEACSGQSQGNCLDPVCSWEAFPPECVNAAGASCDDLDNEGDCNSQFDCTWNAGGGGDDDDGDGVDDSNDSILGNESDVDSSGVGDLNITINGTWSDNPVGNLSVEFLDGTEKMLEFYFNFSGNTSQLNMSKVNITKTDKGIYAQGLENISKTFYVPYTLNGVCVKNDDGVIISPFFCNGTNEYFFRGKNCDGTPVIVNGDSVTCSVSGGNYVISGLTHSGGEAENKGIVPMNSGSPFFTTTQNPTNSTYVSCLESIKPGEVCNQTWQVNATGIEGTTWIFYTAYDSPENSINTSEVNITIRSIPNITQVLVNSTYGTNFTTENLICWANATDADNDNLNYTGYWYKNGVQNISINATGDYPQGTLVNVSTLENSYTSLDENWSCYVRAYDGINYTSYMWSSNLSVKDFNLSNIGCEANGGDNWVDCNSLAYFDNITRTRVKCGDVGENATFNLTNNYDNANFFVNTTSTEAGGYFVLDNDDIQILDSGGWMINVTCEQSGLGADSLNETFYIPFGNLTGGLMVDPAINTNVTQNEFFNVTTSITCVGGECVNVTATLDPQSSDSGEFGVAGNNNLNAEASEGTRKLSEHSDCGSYIDSDFTFTEDINNCSGDGLVVDADNIVIDLNGYTLSGSNASDSVGIVVEGYDNVTVKDGTIMHFSEGMFVGYSNNNGFENLDIIANGFSSGGGGTCDLGSYPPWLYHTDDPDCSDGGTCDYTYSYGTCHNGGGGNGASSESETVSNQREISNGYGFCGDGSCDCWWPVSSYTGAESCCGDVNPMWTTHYCGLSGGDSTGIYLLEASYNLISNCNISNNNHDGIYFDQSDLNNVTYSHINGNSESGIYIDNSNANLIADNSLLENSKEGVYIYSSLFNYFINNTINSNTYQGIYVDDSHYNLIYNNTVSDNSDEGIYLDYADYTEIYYNNITDNSDEGIYYYSNNNADSEIYYNNISNNGGAGILYPDDATIYGNIISSNGDYGIQTNYDGYIVIQNNTIQKNGDGGITLYQSDYCNITDNTVSFNLDTGIYISRSDYTRIVRNRAENNSGGVYAAGFSFVDAYYSTLINNTANSNQDDGFKLGGTIEYHSSYGSRNNTLQGNDASCNGENGLELSPYSHSNDLYDTGSCYNYRINSSLYDIQNKNVASNSVFYGTEVCDKDSPSGICDVSCGCGDGVCSPCMETAYTCPVDCVLDTDDDNVHNYNDTLEGNENNVMRQGIGNLNITIDGAWEDSPNGTKNVEFLDGVEKLLEFDFEFNFTNRINLTQVNLTKTDKGIYAQGLANISKTFYIPYSLKGVCVKNDDGVIIDVMNCNGVNEHFFNPSECDGSSVVINGDSVTCTITGENYVISGLTHSGGEAVAKGTIPMNSGTPFYTIDQNPTNSTYVSCLESIKPGEVCNQTWQVNATGNHSTTWIFFASYDSPHSSNVTNNVNITILDEEDPTYSNPINTSVDFKRYSNFTANITLYNSALSTYIFSTNASGTWVNTTVGLNNESIYTASEETNITGAGSDDNVCWYYWFNDTAGNNVSSDTYCFVVNNTKPYFDPDLENQTIAENSTLVYDINCSDVDDDALTYYINDTSKFDINSTNGLINWTPGFVDAGVYWYNVTCGDGSTNVLQEFNITVTNTNRVPEMQQAFVNSSLGTNLTTENLTCYVNATDSDADLLNYTGYWYKEGVQNESITANNDYTQGTLVNVSTLDNSSTSIGDNWSCRVRAYDGRNYSDYLFSGNLTVLEYTFCGNNVTETGEECDGTDLSGETCVSQGYDSGTLACSPICVFDTGACESEGDGGGGGCTDKCEEDERECVTNTSYRECGNYDADDCLEWSSEIECDEGEYCEDGTCVAPCIEDWECEDWGECIDGTQTRSCIDANDCGTIENQPNVSRACVIECVENWTCSWTSCSDDDEYSYAYDCIDVNNCGTEFNKPEQLECDEAEEETIRRYGGCEPVWDCEPWGECETSYTVEDLLREDVDTSGVKKRICVDKTSCAGEVVEKMPCSVSVPVEAATVEWCQEDYVEIKEKETKKLVSRVKKDKSRAEEVFNISELNRVDISFLTGEFTGYCDYCYNGIQDYDEEGVDCGGPNCPMCIVKEKYFDWLPLLTILLWLLVLGGSGRIIWTQRSEIINYYKDLGRQKMPPSTKGVSETALGRKGIPRRIAKGKGELAKVKRKGIFKRIVEGIRPREKAFKATPKTFEGIRRTKSDIGEKGAHRIGRSLEQRQAESRRFSLARKFREIFERKPKPAPRAEAAEKVQKIARKKSGLDKARQAIRETKGKLRSDI